MKQETTKEFNKRLNKFKSKADCRNCKHTGICKLLDCAFKLDGIISSEQVDSNYQSKTWIKNPNVVANTIRGLLAENCTHFESKETSHLENKISKLQAENADLRKSLK